MRSDPELEAALRRYQPAGPPPELRASVVTSSRRAPRTWPWAMAAAALLMIAVAFGAAGKGAGSAGPDDTGAITAVFSDPEALDALEHVYGPGLTVVIAYTASLAAATVETPADSPAELPPWR